MSDILTMTFSINGEFPDTSMIDWVAHRAGILNLSGQIHFQNTTCINLTVSGEKVLVDAFEVACSLGPVNAMVHSITMQETPTPGSFYRQPRQFIRY